MVAKGKKNKKRSPDWYRQWRKKEACVRRGGGENGQGSGRRCGVSGCDACSSSRGGRKDVEGTEESARRQEGEPAENIQDAVLGQ